MTDQASPTAVPGFRLHSADNVAIATFVGAPIGGAWLMASNARKLGDSARANMMLILGFVGTAALLAIAFVIAEVLPEFPSYFMPAVYTAGMRKWALHSQGDAFRAHQASGGLNASSWTALGIGLVSLLGVFLVLAVVLVGVALGGADSAQNRVRVNEAQYVYYESGATQVEAVQLGEELKTAGIFDGLRPVDVKLARKPNKSGYAVSFVVGAESLGSLQTEEAFRVVGKRIKERLLEPIEVELCDGNWAAQKTLQIPCEQGCGWNPNGQKQGEVSYKGSAELGLVTGWYENGQKRSEVTFRDGKEEGLATWWYRNGQKETEVTFWHGTREGSQTLWYENGAKLKMVTFKDGQEDGPATLWQENGQKMSDGTFKAGRKVGLWTEWDSTGKKTSEVLYKDGKPVTK